MKIDQIILFNFGSYEGENIFDTKVRDGKNIILIGGKNGAGKTTLFTAMRLCMYGYMSLGYKNINSFYTRAVIKLINNNAKMEKPAKASVSMKMELSNGQDLDTYSLVRSWVLTESLSESFSIEKNGFSLPQNEIADFEKYLLSLIPPELFNLYFFDGEKIADFFMEEGSNSRIKDAFLTLCGYDTFDIMRKNFKRISTGNGESFEALNDYLEASDAYSNAQATATKAEADLKNCKDSLSTCEADIMLLDKNYSASGGITQEEWNQKEYVLKEQEKKRENYNTWLKKWANDLVPFLMIREQVLSVKNQIGKENNNLKYRSFCEIIQSDAVRNAISSCGIEDVSSIKEAAYTTFGGEQSDILDLSFEQSSRVLSQTNRILEFDASKIEKYKRAIKKSISISAKIRKELENSSISTVHEYMQQKSELYEKKSTILNHQIQLEQDLSSQREILEQQKVVFNKMQIALESELKKASINDISAKAIVMLDKLQSILYFHQIKKVENFFKGEIKTLMRKTHIIDDIHIDADFGIHIYRNDEIQFNKLGDILFTNSEEQINMLLGEKAVSTLMNDAGVNTIDELLLYCKAKRNVSIVLPIEIDKSSLSNGEKQIFIMALYHSLVQLCNHEIPFIIDTPFARIDTEHRRNISKYFFSKLNAQVFILSTNEEIDSSHVQIMKDKILATYILENQDNKHTTVVKNSYFEV